MSLQDRKRRANIKERVIAIEEAILGRIDDMEREPVQQLLCHRSFRPHHPIFKRVTIEVRSDEFVELAFVRHDYRSRRTVVRVHGNPDEIAATVEAILFTPTNQ